VNWLQYYGGAAGRVGNTETAFPHRQVPWDIVVVAQWTEAGETPTHQAWAGAVVEALAPYASGGHILGVLDADEVANSAFGSNLQRPATIKKQYDPSNPEDMTFAKTGEYFISWIRELSALWPS
jgi:hypothetical protein